MNTRTKAVICAVTMGSVLAAAPVMARNDVAVASGDDGAKRSGRLEEGLGVGGGAAIGALAGGPIGMIIGAGVGVWLGSRVHDARQLDETQSALEQTRSSLVERDGEVAALSADKAALSAALAERESQLVRFTGIAERAEHANEELRQALASGLELQVMFRTGASELTAQSAQQLEQLAGVLAGIEGISVRLDGYADPRGDSGYNEMLAAERVASVQQAMLRGGLDKAQLKGFAHGESRYAAGEGDLDAYALARRVDISLLARESDGGAAVEGELAVLSAP